MLNGWTIIMQNNFVTLLNKYLTGKNWLKARPKSVELEDRFYFKVVKPMAELIGTAPEALKADFKAILAVCSKFSVVSVTHREIIKPTQACKA